MIIHALVGNKGLLLRTVTHTTGKTYYAGCANHPTKDESTSAYGRPCVTLTSSSSAYRCKPSVFCQWLGIQIGRDMMEALFAFLL